MARDSCEDCRFKSDEFAGTAHNTFAKMFAIVDEEGDIDVDGLMEDLKEQINAKGKIEIHIPMFGKFCFNASDVHKLHRMIVEG